MNKSLPSVKVAKKRISYFDVLRTVAIFFVVVIHCCIVPFSSLSIGSRNWLATVLFESASRWAVPIFMMISGALHLSKKRDVSTFFKKNVLKIVIILLSWRLVYAIADVSAGSSLLDYVYGFVRGHYHLWFLYMLLGLYLITPFLKAFLDDPKLLKLYLLISFIFGIALPELVDIFIAIPSCFDDIALRLEHSLGLFGFGKLLGYSFYFVLGYYLYHKKPKTKYVKKIYIAGLIGLLFTFFMTWWFSVMTNSPTSIFIKDLTINNTLMSVGVFTFVRRHTSKSLLSKTLIRMSKYSLGIYVIHVLLLEKVLVLLSPMPAFLDIPIKATLCFFACLALTFCLRKIPFIKRIV